MNRTDDIIRQFILYYAKFVHKDILRKQFIQPSNSKYPGYNELSAEILALPDSDVIPQIENFIFSTNSKYVSENVRNSKGFLLFVEYGEISFEPLKQNGITEKIGITVAIEQTVANNSLINETLAMNQAYNILISLIMQMRFDQSNLECSVYTLIDFPAKIYPVESQHFFDHIGWSAILERSNTLI